MTCKISKIAQFRFVDSKIVDFGYLVMSVFLPKGSFSLNSKGDFELNLTTKSQNSLAKSPYPKPVPTSGCAPHTPAAAQARRHYAPLTTSPLNFRHPHEQNLKIRIWLIHDQWNVLICAMTKLTYMHVIIFNPRKPLWRHVGTYGKLCW